MLLVEDFRVSGRDDDEVTKNARDYLERVSPILEAGLSDEKSYRGADVVAHIAWVNWLKNRFLYENANVDENLNRALQMDPTNVYAHAMIGNLLLNDHASLEEAKKHFGIALQTGKARSFVRAFQLGAMIDNDSPGVRAELIRVINDMRKQGEAIRDERRGRIHRYYDPNIEGDEELKEVLTAVPPDEGWATYLWVDRPLKEWHPFSPTDQKFIQASLYEIAGKNDDALQLYLQLQHDTASDDKTRLLPTRIGAAIKRLSH
jgi:DNA-binding PadR family transcriptional regulator